MINKQQWLIYKLKYLKEFKKIQKFKKTQKFAKQKNLESCKIIRKVKTNWKIKGTTKEFQKFQKKFKIFHFFLAKSKKKWKIKL